MAELKYYDAGSGTWKSLSVSTPPEVYVGIDPPAPRDQQLLWVDPDESPPAIVRDITMDPWHLVGAAGEPAFQNSWANYGAGNGTAAFRKYPDGKVKLTGMVKTGAAGTTCFTLPVGYRPLFDRVFTIASYGGPGSVTVTAAGAVVIGNAVGNVTTNAYLDGVEFDTESVSSVTSVVAQPMEPWHTVGATGEPAFLNSYVNSASGPTPVGFRKDPFGRVHIKGSVRTGTNNTAVFMLPVGYRPPTPRYYTCLGDAGAAGNFVYVNTDGSVTGTRTGTDLHFGDIEFDTETVNNWTPATLPANVIALDSWHQVGAAGEPAFNPPWAKYAGAEEPAFRKDPTGKVSLRGIAINSGGVFSYGAAEGGNKSIFQLPAGYRPPDYVNFVMQHWRSDGIYCAIRVNVGPAGWVNLWGDVAGTGSAGLGASGTTNSLQPLDGITFDTESVQNVSSSVAQPMDSWHLIGGSGEPSFSAGWTQYAGGEPIGFRKYPDGRVRLKGIANGATPTSTAFTLPAGYRPPLAQRFTCVSGGGPANVQVNTDGTVQWVSSTNFYNAASYIDFSTIEFDTQTVSAYTTGLVQLASPAKVTTLPVAPVDGQEVYYVADATNGILWHLRYNASSASAYKWEMIGGAAIYANGESAATAAGGVGATDTAVPVPLAGDYDVQFGAAITHTSGQITIGVGQSSILYDIFNDNLGYTPMHRVARVPGLIAGTTLKLYINNSNSATSYRRHVRALPVRVG